MERKKFGLVRNVQVATIQSNNDYPVDFLPPGGHITKIPASCPYKSKTFVFNKVECLDFGICQACCKEKNKCTRRKEWVANKYGEYHHLLFNWKKAQGK